MRITLSVSEPRPRRKCLLGVVSTSVIFPVLVALFAVGCGSAGSTPTGPSNPTGISEKTKEQSRVAVQDIIDRILPAMHQREHASSMASELKDLNSEIQRDGRTSALASLPLLRARAATWSAAEPADSDDRINLVVIQLYLDWVEQALL